MKSTMKKIILLSAFVLLLLCLSPAAFAEEYCALGTYPAGSEISCYIGQIPADAVGEAYGLPAGCRLVQTEGINCRHLSIQGVPQTAGSVQFSVDVPGTMSSFICSMDISPAVPRISITRDFSIYRGSGALLEVSAATGDGGRLSYQWYSGVGFAALPIDGATLPSYRPDTSQLGSYAYCCEVTNSNNGLTSSAMSDPVMVYVTSPVVTGISIETLPSRSQYQPGDKLDISGLSIRVSYGDGSSEVIYDCFGVDPMQFSSAGTQTVRITYQNCSCSFNVNVGTREDSVQGIGVMTLPTKTEYKVGDNLETAGLSIRAYTPDGHFDVSSGLDCSPVVMTSAGSQTITVKYAGKTCTFKVTVKEDKKVKGISVVTVPAKRDYTVGDTLDTAGLSVVLNTSSGTEPLTGGYACTPKVLTKEGTQQINVIYGQYSTSFNVTVKAKDTAPTPKPTATPGPSPSPAADTGDTSPSPSVSPARSSGAKPDHAKSPNTLVKVIFVVALIALGGLTGFIFYMQKKGKR